MKNPESISVNIAGTTFCKTNYQQNEAVVHKNGTIGSKTVDQKLNVVMATPESISVNIAGTELQSNSKSEHL